MDDPALVEADEPEPEESEELAELEALGFQDLSDEELSFLVGLTSGC